MSDSGSNAPLRFNSATSLGQAALILALTIALSRVSGLGRLLVTAHFYGQNALTDAYNAAFAIPDALSILIAGGALATGFVPAFTALLAREDYDGARRTFRSLWTLLLGAFGALTIALWALTWTGWGAQWATWQAPGHEALYLELLRVLLGAQFIFVCGGIFTGALNALRWFWFPALAPLLFNIGIVLGGVWGGVTGAGIQAQAWGAVGGALAGSLLIQVPAVRRAGLSLAPLWAPRDEGVRRVLATLAPVFFGLASGRLIALVLPRLLAGPLPPGSTTAIDNANRLMQLPLDLLASGLAIAIFPTLSLLAAQGKADEARGLLENAFGRTMKLMALSTMALLVLALLAREWAFGFGRFSADDMRLAANALIVYAFALPGLGAQQLLARAFYARGEVVVPVCGGAVAMLAFWVGGAFLVRAGGGAPGLALVAVLCVSGLSLYLGWALRRASPRRAN